MLGTAESAWPRMTSPDLPLFSQTLLKTVDDIWSEATNTTLKATKLLEDLVRVEGILVLCAHQTAVLHAPLDRDDGLGVFC